MPPKPEQVKKRGGMPAFKPSDAERKRVETLSGYGLPMEQIAILVREGGINVETLVKYFKLELVSGKAKANAKVGGTLFQKATGGDTAAMIWWSKTQLRWAETQKHEITGADGAPIEFARIERVIVDKADK